MRPQRRFHDSKFLIPSIEGEKLDICIAFDTSGSCYEIVKRILGVILEINEAIENSNPEEAFVIHLLYCDCGEPQHQIWKGKKDLPHIRNAGGGTSFRPVMNWIMRENRKHPEKIKKLTLYNGRGEQRLRGKPRDCSDLGNP
jgi:predicted metal-dependent peptidase